MDQAASLSDRLQDWYGQTSSRRVDLVGDYAGKELFLLEGDSLLLHCFNDPRLDFGDGFQLLHAVYAVECFLLGLVQRHCHFHIVFFEMHRDLCKPKGADDTRGAKYFLARTVVRRHLEVNLAQSWPSIRIETFQSLQDQAFQRYLDSTGVYFIMCHDGASMASSLTSPRDIASDDAMTTDFTQFEKARKLRFRSMILKLMKQGYNIALINGLEFIDTKIMTIVVEGSQRVSLQHDLEDSARSKPQSPDGRSDIACLEQTLLTFRLQQCSTSIPSEPLTCQCPESTPVYVGELTERVIATLIVLGRMLEEHLVAERLAMSFLIHMILVQLVPLSHRRLEFSEEEDQHTIEVNLFLSSFARLSSKLLSDIVWTKVMESNKVPCDIFDLVDGRLFRAILFETDEVVFDARLTTQFEKVAHLLCAISGTHLTRSKSKHPRKGIARAPELSLTADISILPFFSPVFEEHLSPISLRVAQSGYPDRISGRIHQEVSHWHNAKRRLDPKTIQVTPMSVRDKSRALRRNQFFMAEMQAYAASLTNAAGKALEPETVTLTENNIPERSKGIKTSKQVSEKPQKLKATPNRKGAGKKAMLEDIAANKAVKDGENDERLFSAWKTYRKNLESGRSVQSKYLKIKAYLRDLPDAKRAVLQAEVEYNLLCILYGIYRNMRKSTDSQAGVMASEELSGVAALIWDTSRRLTTAHGLTKTIADRLANIVKALKLPDPEISTPSIDRKLAYDPEILLPKGDELVVGLDATRFQLLHCGPYMDRNLDSAPDPRVPFQPDGWQRSVLDELDARNSVFVVAPTSAGKTFISFYAMEKILRGSDDHVLIYVAPTKALVNQIAAEIQARFKKSYKHAGKSVWGIHTRDYRINNPTGCQILVTVPHILQIMLLAPGNAKSWSTRVRYIIFDEIHSIGQAEDGVVWEQLLLLAPCPIIALSATVGNPETFNSWLNSTQQSLEHRVTMIKHQHRYSDLRKFVFNPPKKFSFRGLPEHPSFATLGLDGLEGLSFVHPIASLVYKSRGMPDDLSLEARDCLSLLNAMKRHATSEYPVNPELEFSNRQTSTAIRKADIIGWERDLKSQLKIWMGEHDSPFDAVLAELSDSMEKGAPVAQEVSKGELVDNADDFATIDPDNLYATTLPLLCKLHQRDALPAIFFNYDRHRCENIAKAVMRQLKDAETRWKETNLAWKTKVSGFEKWKLEKEKFGSKKSAKVMPKKKGRGAEDEDPSSKMDKIQDVASEEADPYANFDPDAPVDGFHFAARHVVENAELSNYFWQMKRRGLSSWLAEALLRGIGVHHAGMNRKYRQVVEMLFRKGYLRVVIATGTLALGINMPCATVVFSGDSIFLTALNFRQAAGRAGRRGFDLLGNVVFQGLSHGKICRLLSSRLPDLNGHFPVTTTLVLRLFTLLHESGESDYAVRAIKSLLSQPRLYLEGPAFKDQVLHHLRFSIEYLRRQDLVSPKGAPINFAGLTSHLYFTGNSSFALNALIKGGYFHELCSEINNKESHVLRTLMVVMAHLFGRRPCREADAEYVENIVKRSPSIVFLPPLPPKATMILRDHNKDTLQVFSTYVRTFVEQHIKEDDNTLPLSGMKAGGANEDIVLPGSMNPTKIRSSFIALSSHGDEFESISELCRTSRGGIFLEEAVIPHLDVYPDESQTPLNAYLYDFYMHGDLEALERANGVKKSDVWFLLNDFSLVLATITASLANFMKLPESDLSLVDVIGEGDETNNAEDDIFAADTTDTESVATSTTTDTGKTSVSSAPSTGSKSKAKKKVAESWEDSEDEEDSEAEVVDVSVNNDQSEQELERGFLNIYKAIMKLRVEFDTKFRKIFA